MDSAKLNEAFKKHRVLMLDVLTYSNILLLLERSAAALVRVFLLAI